MYHIRRNISICQIHTAQMNMKYFILFKKLTSISNLSPLCTSLATLQRYSCITLQNVYFKKWYIKQSLNNSLKKAKIARCTHCNYSNKRQDIVQYIHTWSFVDYYMTKENAHVLLFTCRKHCVTTNNNCPNCAWRIISALLLIST